MSKPLNASSIHFIRIDNPPVNGLNHAVRQYIVAELDAAESNESVTAVVLMGAGKVFSGGADMREFGTPMEAAEPHLSTVIARLENFPKKVIAVLHGVAMGGGLELAMGCHYRLITTSCKIALPEIKLGLMPGGGGTQRLPRLSSVEMALEVIVSGETFLPSHFSGSALFDAVINDGDTVAIETEAEVFVATLDKLNTRQQLPRARERAVTINDTSSAALAQAKLAAQATAQWYPAPLKCIAAIEASASLAFSQGLERERVLFLSLLESAASKALRYQFFSERAAGKIRDLPAGVSIAAPTMVVLVGSSARADYLATMLERADIAVSRLTQQDLNQGDGDEVLTAADMVVSCDTDNGEDLMRLFEALEKRITASCLLVTLSHNAVLDRVAGQAARPENIAGLYIGEARDNLPVFEIIRGGATSPQVTAALMSLCKRIRKTGIVAPSREGFIGPRLLATVMQHRKIVIETGVPEWRVDEALRAFGFLEGPCLRADADGSRPNGEYADAGRTPNDIATDIVRALGDEAALLLEESDVSTAADVDMVFTRAYGFPRHCGGPVYYRKQEASA